MRFAQVTATLPIAGAHTLYRLQAAGEDESSHSVQLNGKVLALGAVRMRKTHIYISFAMPFKMISLPRQAREKHRRRGKAQREMGVWQGGALPDMPGLSGSGGTVELGPLDVVFAVLHGLNASACTAAAATTA